MKQSLLILVSLFLMVRVFAQTPWAVSGNSGLTTSNFIGTTNNVPLILKVNNQWAGFTGHQDKSNVSFGYLSLTNALGTGDANTAMGVQALRWNSAGSGNVAIGRWALEWCTKGDNNVAVGLGAMGGSMTPGSNNVAIGQTALFNNKQSENTAVGAAALFNNTDGTGLTGVGFKSLCNNTTGEFNTALGYQALLLNTTGYWNVALGSGSLQNNRTGRFNTAGGNSSLHFNSTGIENTAFGEQALGGNLDGSFNTAVGCRSLWSVTYTQGTGDSGYGHGGANTAVGYESLWGVTTGSSNVAMGVKTMHDNSSGSNNIAFGGSALYYNTTGNNNIAIGDNALNKNMSGSYNIAIGSGAGVSKDNLTNAVAIGYGAKATESNQVFIGNHNVTTIRSYAHLATVSDARVKKNIQKNVPGLDFINQLQPVTYNMDYDAMNNLTRSDKQQEEQPVMRADHKNRLHTGFIAQEVEKAAENIGYDFAGIDKENGDNGLYALNYSGLIPALVKSVQELSDRINAKDETIAALQKRIEQLESADNSAIELLQNHVEQWGAWEHDHTQLSCNLEKRIGELNVIADSAIGALQVHVKEWGNWEHDHQILSNALQTQITDLSETAVRLEAYHLPTSTNNINPSPSANTLLEQNYPNPFNQSTTINYTLPQHFHSAKMIIIDMSGKTVKQVPLPSESGRNSVKIDAGSLPAGTYFYSLNVDNSVIDTKKMILTK